MTAAGLVVPMAHQFGSKLNYGNINGSFHRLPVLSFVNVNDGFWMIKEYFGLSLKGNFCFRGQLLLPS